MGALNARIEQLETNGCALITLMVSNDLNDLKRYKQMFNFEDEDDPRPQGAAGSNASLAGSSSDGQFFAHPLDPSLMVPRYKLRWPLEFLVHGNKYGQIPKDAELLPETLRATATSDANQLSIL